MTIHFARLADRGAIRIAGEAAHEFLQNLVTNDVAKADRAGAAYAALLTPQGKIIADFFIVKAAADAYVLDVPAACTGDLMKRLTLYRLRAQITLTDISVAVATFVVWSDAAGPIDRDALTLPPESLAFADPRTAAMGARLLVPAATAPSGPGLSPASEADYHAHRIALGVPNSGRDFVYGDTFAHEALLDRLDGVDFTKGCYVGQEVVSRMQHRGTARKRIVPVAADTALPATGAEIRAGAAVIGTLGSVDGMRGLALVRLDRADSAAQTGVPITAGDTAIRLDQSAFGAPASAAGVA